tara:strand:+ start:1009 stop:1233 length:225 start_codon:yes stop_codon:yes gene_type:complete
MNRSDRRKKAIMQVEEAIEHLNYSLSRLKAGHRLEDLEGILTPGTTFADAALDTCCDAAHDPDCQETEEQGGEQ